MLRADLALVGFGHVGRRFALLLEESRDYLSDEHQLECRIVGIATRRHGSIFDPDGIDARALSAPAKSDQVLGDGMTVAEIIANLRGTDADLRVLTETTTLCIRDGQPAIAHVEAALNAACHVITANKGPVSFAYRRLMELARRHGVSFLFEGAVMDGIPLFNLIRETMPGVTVNGFRGIVNTTTQHVLTALESGEPFAGALARMQQLGIAEADPSLDVDGWDAAAKTAALANVLLDATLTPHAIERDALGPATAVAARMAVAAGRRLRLVISATGRRQDVQAAVRLIELDPHDMLATLPGTGNGLILTTDLLGEVAICQMGGDLTQTAYALLSDLITVRRRVRTETRS